MSISTAGNIIDAAVEKMLIFDGGRTEVADDDVPILAFLDRAIQELYLVAATPPDDPATERSDFFAVSGDKTLVAGTIALEEYAWTPMLVSAAGVDIKVAPYLQIQRGTAELAPAVYIRGLNMTTAGRAGDPGLTDVITVHYTPRPGPLTDRTHFLGATTPATESTSKWPSFVADATLISMLVNYFLIKSGDATQADLQAAGEDMAATRSSFLRHVRSVH